MWASKNLLRSIRRCLAQLLQPLRGFFRPKATGSRTAVQARSASLCALTLAAMALPGVMMLQPACAAEGDLVGLQYGHYWEGKRNLYGVTSKFDPIQVDSLYDTAKFTLTDRLKGVFNFSQDTWSGATPISTAPAVFQGNRINPLSGMSGASPYINGNLYLDKTTLQPLRATRFGQLLGGTDNRLAQTISGASPETRKQLDFKLSYEWDEAALYMGGGSSMENDYQSRFGNMGGRWDFNQKLTSLNLGVSYTNSEINATLDHDATPYILDACPVDVPCSYASSTSHIDTFSNGNQVLHGTRRDWGASAGLTQVLNKRAQIEMSLGYVRNEGYLSHPYKVVQAAFIEPDQQSFAPPGAYLASIQALMEQRPDVRNQGMLDIRYAQYIDATDAGLHLGYRYYQDDWGIKAHTMEADWAQPFGNSWIGDGWTITPRARYYSQEAADFYTTLLVTHQAAIPFFDRSKLPAHYSSDWRLSGFGTMSGGGSISKRFRRGVTLDAGFEYYAHAGGLKLGGGGEGSYADFHYYTVNAALKIDLDTIASARNASGDDDGHQEHDHGGDDHHAVHAPAGVLYDHMLRKAGDFMIGYRYMYRHQAGQTLHGSDSVGDQTLVKNGCNGNPCFITPTEMNMHMHMLEIMYAPTDWLTLMVMPQYVDMNMSMRELDGAPTATGDDATLVAHHALHPHTTGGIGDTGLYALFKILDELGQHGHATLGLSAPTGSVGEKYRDTHQVDAGFEDYGMQLGSGTWDFKPSLTYMGQMNPWSWGGQVSGTVRMEDKNSSGYKLGDVFQSTAWGSYSLLEVLSASLRGLYTQEGSIDGEFTGTFHKLGPNDYTSNYGGRFWDVGLGLTAVIPRGSFKGNRFAVEWLQPVKDDVNGYQLERKGFLTASWSVDF